MGAAQFNALMEGDVCSRIAMINNMITDVVMSVGRSL